MDQKKGIIGALILLVIVAILADRPKTTEPEIVAIQDDHMPRSEVFTNMETADAEFVEIAAEKKKEMESLSAETQEKAEVQAAQPEQSIIELMACVVWTEAGNQSETGKRLVVATILNRCETPGFPDTIYEVITQKSQYSYGSYYTQECMDAVLLELQTRTDYNVLWFWTTGFPPYGTPLYQHGGHYFSGKPL